MNILFSIFIFVLVIILSLTIHELGHFIFAKIFKVRVYEFSIGIGPTLFSYRLNNTLYSFRLLPIMAYVSLSSRKINNYNKEIFNDIKNDPKIDSNLINISNKEHLRLLFKEKLSINNIKIFFIHKEYRKYNDIVKNSHNAINIEDVSMWKNSLIILGGITMNILLFLIAFLILYFGLNEQISILDNIKFFFIDLWKIFLFQKTSNNNVNVSINNIFLINLITINLSLFLLNVLPIPPLDGFKFFSILYEKTFKKQIPESVDIFFGIIGIIFIVYLSIAGIVNNFLE